jgi:hypothetical protein
MQPTARCNKALGDSCSERPERTNCTASRRNSGGYGGLLSGMADILSRPSHKFHCAARVGLARSCPTAGFSFLHDCQEVVGVVVQPKLIGLGAYVVMDYHRHKAG